MNVFNNFTQFDNDGVMLAFRGEITPPLLDSLLELAERRLHLLSIERPTRKKAFNVLVECLQNLFVHGAGEHDAADDDPAGMIIMVASEDGVRISTGNTIPIQKAEALEERLNHLDVLDQKELRTQYKDQLVNGKLSEVGGAGLGFIDIARRSGRKMGYRFSPIDDQRLFFTFDVKVS